MIEKFDFTWSRLRNTQVGMIDSSSTTVGTVLSDVCGLKIPNGNCKVTCFDLYKCGYLLAREGVITPICDYKLGWSSYVSALEEAIRVVTKDLVLTYKRDSDKQELGILNVKNPFDYTVLGDKKGYYRVRPFDGFWSDVYKVGFGYDGFETLGFEGSFLASVNWFEDFIHEWVLVNFVMSLWWNLKFLDVSDYVKDNYKVEVHGKVEDYVKVLKREVLLLLSRVEVYLRDSKVKFDKFDSFEDLCDYVKDRPGIAFYHTTSYIEPLGLDGWYRVVMNLQDECYVSKVVEFDIQWLDGNIYEGNNRYVLSDTLDKFVVR